MWVPTVLGKMLMAMGAKKTPIAQSLEIPLQQPLRDREGRIEEEFNISSLSFD